MQYTSLLPAFLFTSLTLASSSQVTFTDDDKLNVPGANPLKFCADPSDYILELSNVDLDPNPPQAYVSHNFHS